MRTDPSLEVLSEARSRAGALSAGLYSHQVEGLAFLLARRGAILADDMGLGKTRQAILGLAEGAGGGPYLVVCPASVKANWRREILAVRPDDEVHIVGEEAPADWKGWVVINYDILKRHFDWLEGMPFQGVVFDEAHYLKNHTSQRSRLARQLLDRETRPLTYLLTGTPLTNRPRDLFPLLQLIRHPLGRSFLSFAKRYCEAERNEYGWVTTGASRLDELALQLKGVMLRRTKNEVLELPPKVRTFLDVEVPDGTAARESRKVLELLLQGAGAGRGGGAQDGQLLSKLNKVRHAIAKAKAKATLDFVTGTVAQGEKVLVFSAYDAPLELISKKLGDECVVLNGKTPSKKRQDLVDRFQDDPEVKVFAANLHAGGVGLNLTAARQVVFNDLDWVPANHWQAEDRAYRIGQTGSVHVAYMTAPGTFDDWMQTVLEAKAELVDAVIEGKALDGSMQGSALQELQGLLRDISPRLSDPSLDRSNPEWVREVLAEAVQRFRAAAGGSPAPERDGASGAVDERLIDMLAAVLSGPQETSFRIEAGSSPGQYYELDANGPDVTCSCPGFQYRGMCRHARTLKEHLVAGTPPPDEYELKSGDAA